MDQGLTSWTEMKWRLWRLCVLALWLWCDSKFHWCRNMDPWIVSLALGFYVYWIDFIFICCVCEPFMTELNNSCAFSLIKRITCVISYTVIFSFFFHFILCKYSFWISLWLCQYKKTLICHQCFKCRHAFEQPSANFHTNLIYIHKVKYIRWMSASG